MSIAQPRAGIVWRTDDGVALRFIGPSLPFIEGKNAINGNSVAFILKYRKFRILFTGDAGVAAERRFLDEGIDLHADLLKVWHHGSAYSSSSDFISAVQPRYAIISVGRHNRFGYPAPSTIASLEQSSATVMRTDENGAVLIESDGNSNYGLSAQVSPRPRASRVEFSSSRFIASLHHLLPQIWRARPAIGYVPEYRGADDPSDQWATGIKKHVHGSTILSPTSNTTGERSRSAPQLSPAFALSAIDVKIIRWGYHALPSSFKY